jgi:hypothetical protein
MLDPKQLRLSKPVEMSATTVRPNLQEPVAPVSMKPKEPIGTDRRKTVPPEQVVTERRKPVPSESVGTRSQSKPPEPIVVERRKAATLISN